MRRRVTSVQFCRVTFRRYPVEEAVGATVFLIILVTKIVRKCIARVSNSK